MPNERSAELAAAIIPYLIRHASSSQDNRVTYWKLSQDIRGTPSGRGLGRALEMVWRWCDTKGIPRLSAMVVMKATGEVADGYPQDKGPPDKERQQAFQQAEAGKLKNLSPSAEELLENYLKQVPGARRA